MGSTRTSAARRWSWVLLVAAVATAGFAALLWQRQRSEASAVVLDVPTELAASTPLTIPPLTIPPLTIPPVTVPITPPATTTTPAPSTTPTTTPDTTDSDEPVVTAPPPTQPSSGRSPLGDVLGPRGTAIPPVVEPRIRPRSLRIDVLDLDRPVRPVGLEDDGALEIPDETEIGWYRYGAAPGLPGATVLAAHVTWNRTIGPFFRLGELEPGDRVDLTLDNGARRVYEVVERTMYDKDELPRSRIWRTSGPESLVLITCGGDYNPDIRRYRQNIVVYAVPVEMIAEGAT